MCLQESHCNYQTVETWKNEWKNLVAGEVLGTVGLVIQGCKHSFEKKKKFPFNLTETFRDQNGRVINFNIDNGVFKLAFKCIYSPNDGIDRKLFFKSLLFEESKYEIYIYNVICGDYNCVLDKNINRDSIHSRDDAGLSELRSIIENKFV